MNGGHDKYDLRRRTKQFALRVIKLYSSLPAGDEKWVLGRQLLRSGTSVGTHYREANRARSAAEFISKMESGLQELDETAYWMELLVESATLREEQLQPLMKEANELIAMFVASVKTAKGNS
jgi:four helix bundle protein